MRRRQFLGWGAGLGIYPIDLHAEQSPAQGNRTIGVLIGSFEAADQNAKREITEFEKYLTLAEWYPGHNINIEYRFCGGHLERIRAAAQDLIALKPALVLTRAVPATVEVLRLTKTIPVVFVQVTDPVHNGFVRSFARPESNATGFTNLEASMATKWLSLLRELRPELPHVSMLYHSATSIGRGEFFASPFVSGAQALNMTSAAVAVEDIENIKKAVAEVRRQKGAVIIAPGSFLAGLHREIIEVIATDKVPAIYAFSYWAKEGGLMSYGIDAVDLFRGAASYVDRILKGAQPTALPVQAPTRFQLILNLTTAKRIGLEIPNSLQARADEVIE